MRMRSLSTNQGFKLLGLLLAATTAALATPCGTVASPTSCSITVGPAGSEVMFSVTNWDFVSASATGGGNVYDGADISIDIATGGGLTALLTFDKVADDQGIVFLANPGQFASFTFSYDLTLTAVSPGVADFASMTTNLFGAPATGNAFGTLQKITPGFPACIAINPSNMSETCALPGTQPATIEIGDILSLTGGTTGSPPSGNVGVTEFSNLFEASFTPGVAPVPEPSTIALIGLGLVALGVVRRGQTTR